MPPAPSAAKMAAEDKIDLAAVVGSGKRGQVLKGDVIAAAASRAPSPVARGDAITSACAHPSLHSGSDACSASDDAR